MGVHKATLMAAGLKASDVVEIEIERDDEPLPGDVVPELLAKALRKNATARKAWESLAPSRRREHVGYIKEAKKDETQSARRQDTEGAHVEAEAKVDRDRRLLKDSETIPSRHDMDLQGEPETGASPCRTVGGRRPLLATRVRPGEAPPAQDAAHHQR